MRRTALTLVCTLAIGCNESSAEKKSVQRNIKAVTKTAEVVKTDAQGRTAEQRNILAKLKEDNRPGAIKHLYVISAMSGDVLIYSPVDGKVTSSGKRLTPTSVVGTDGSHVDRSSRGIYVNIDGKGKYTHEVLQDDGTYGRSIPYLYWTDTKGIFHKHYVSGGQIIHISSQPMRVGKIKIDISGGEDADGK